MRLRKNIIVKVFSILLVLALVSQQAGFAEVIDLRDEIGGLGFQQHLLAGLVGFASAQAMKPTWNVTQMFIYTYIIPLAANEVTKGIKNPYLRAAAQAAISAGAQGYFDYKDAAKALEKEAVSEVAKETAKKAAENVLKGALVTATTAVGMAVVGEYGEEHGWKGWTYLAQVVVGTALDAGLKGELGIYFKTEEDVGTYVRELDKKIDFGKALTIALKDKVFLRRLEAEGARVVIEELGRLAGIDEQFLTCVGAGLSRVIAAKLTKEDKEKIEAQKASNAMQIEEWEHKLQYSDLTDGEREQLEKNIALFRNWNDNLGKTLNIKDTQLFWQGVQLGMVSVALQYLSKQTKSPLHGAMFNLAASAILQGALIKGALLLQANGFEPRSAEIDGAIYTIGSDGTLTTTGPDGQTTTWTMLPDDAGGISWFNGKDKISLTSKPELAGLLFTDPKDILQRASRGLWLFLGLFRYAFTQATADIMSMGRAGYRPVGDSFEFAWHSGWDPWTLSRYTQYLKELRDDGFLSALYSQFISSYHYQAVQNIGDILSGEINRKLYINDRNIAERTSIRFVQAQLLLYNAGNIMVAGYNERLENIGKEEADLEARYPNIGELAKKMEEEERAKQAKPADSSARGTAAVGAPAVTTERAAAPTAAPEAKGAQDEQQAAANRYRALQKEKKMLEDTRQYLTSSLDIAKALQQNNEKNIRAGIMAHAFGLLPTIGAIFNLPSETGQVGLMLANAAALSQDPQKPIKDYINHMEALMQDDKLEPSERDVLISTWDKLGRYLEARQDDMDVKILREFDADMFNLDAFDSNFGKKKADGTPEKLAGDGLDNFKKRYSRVVTFTPDLSLRQRAEYSGKLRAGLADVYSRKPDQDIKVKVDGDEYTLKPDRSLIGPDGETWKFNTDSVNGEGAWFNTEMTAALLPRDQPELAGALQMNPAQIQENIEAQRPQIIGEVARGRTFTWYSPEGRSGPEGVWVPSGTRAPKGYVPYNPKLSNLTIEQVLEQHPEDGQKLLPRFQRKVDNEIARRVREERTRSEEVAAVERATASADSYLSTWDTLGAAKYEDLGGYSFYMDRRGPKPKQPPEGPVEINLPRPSPPTPSAPPLPERKPPVVTPDRPGLTPISSPGDFPQHKPSVSHPKAMPPMGPLEMPQEKPITINYPFAQEASLGKGDYGPGSATYNLQFAPDELRKFLNGGIGEASVQAVDSKGNFNDTGRTQKFTFDRATGKMWVVDDSGTKVRTVTRKVYFPDYLEAFRKISAGEGGNISETTLRQMRKEAPVVLDLAAAFVSKGNGDYDKVRGFLETQGVARGDFETRVQLAVQDMFRGRFENIESARQNTAGWNEWAILKENPELAKAYILKHAREHGKDYQAVNSYMKKILGYGISEQEWRGSSGTATSHSASVEPRPAGAPQASIPPSPTTNTFPITTMSTDNPPNPYSGMGGNGTQLALFVVNPIPPISAYRLMIPTTINVRFEWGGKEWFVKEVPKMGRATTQQILAAPKGEPLNLWVFSQKPREGLIGTPVQLVDRDRSKSKKILSSRAPKGFTPKIYPDRPLVVILEGAADYNGAFSTAGHKQMITDLLRAGYTVLTYTVDLDVDIPYYLGQATAAAQRKADLVIIAGHGQPRGIALGREPRKVPGAFSTHYSLDVSDGALLSRTASYFNANAHIILLSCSTGQGVSYSGENVAQVISRVLPGIVVSAPGVPANIQQLLFTNHPRAVNILYWDQKGGGTFKYGHRVDAGPGR